MEPPAEREYKFRKTRGAERAEAMWAVSIAIAHTWAVRKAWVGPLGARCGPRLGSEGARVDRIGQLKLPGLAWVPARARVWKIIFGFELMIF
uniref:Uncharacterized protein n=1 Tax=Cucumis melo TaxID=3656 RepID=A0A9I9D5Q3_CUCME